MSLSRRFLLLLLLVISLGCAVSSDHPVSSLEESAPMPEELLGTWHIVEVAGIDVGSDDDSRLSFERDVGGFLTYELTQRGATVKRTASLAAVGGRLILSMPSDLDDGTWGFACLSLDEAMDELRIYFLTHAAVVRGIRAGVVAGEVHDFDQQELAHLTASTAELIAYFRSHPESFADRVAVLRKQAG